MMTRFLSQPRLRPVLAACLALAASACASIERAALPEPTLLSPPWRSIAATQSIVVDHAPWDAFLAAYAREDAAGVTRVAYGAVSETDRAALSGYLAALETADVERLSRDQQLAYWINLYNAATVDVILDHYPVESIRDITDGALSFGPWDRKVVTVRGQALTLNDVEHRIIRPLFQEPRIHYALNCAAVSCPNLALTAWRAEGLEARLEAAEIAYVNDPRGLTIDEDGRLIGSKIYAWFEEDFGESEAEVIARLAPKAEPTLRARLEGRRRFDRFEYDWALNDDR